MTVYTAPRSADWYGGQEGWVYNDLILTAGLAQHDTLIFLSANTFGWRIADWVVVMPQQDSNGAPAVTFDTGFINTAGNALEVGLEWEQGLTIGRSAAPDFKRASTAAHTLSFGRGRRIGLHVATAPATAVTASRTVRMGLLLLPI